MKCLCPMKETCCKEGKDCCKTGECCKDGKCVCCCKEPCKESCKEPCKGPCEGMKECCPKLMEMFKDCPMMKMFKDCPMMGMMKDCPMMGMMGGKGGKKMMKMFMMMMMMKCMNKMFGCDKKKCKKQWKKPCCDKPCKKPCGDKPCCDKPCSDKPCCDKPCGDKPCEKPCESKCGGMQPVCLNKAPGKMPFACYMSGDNKVAFCKLECPVELMKKIQEKSCPFLADPKNKFVMVYADESKECCRKDLIEIVETACNISIVRLWTDDKGEFHVCHYQKQCKKECKTEDKKAPVEEKKM